jgi:hypothetical protein
MDRRMRARESNFDKNMKRKKEERENEDNKKVSNTSNLTRTE